MSSRILMSSIVVGSLLLIGSPALHAQSIAGLRAHRNFLADDLLQGREAGTEGYLLAARYVESQFRQMGLEPAGSEGYLQPIEFRRFSLVPDSASIKIGDRTLAGSDDFMLSPNAVHENIDVTAPVVFVGYGIEAPDLGRNDWDAVDVEGKIVAYLTGAPASFPTDPRAHYSSNTNKQREAASRGAVGVLTIRTKTDIARTPWERYRGYSNRPSMRWLTSEGTVNNGFPELLAVAALNSSAAEALFAGSGVTLEQVLESAEKGDATPRPLKPVVTIRGRSQHETITSPNVLAMLPGTDPGLRDEYLVYTAHLDHVGTNEALEGDNIYNGAYDNAMGTAILLETARAMVEAPPARTVVFAAVTAEEKGLLGAEYLSKNPTLPAASVVANINLDMPLFLFPTADIIAYGADHSSLGAVAERVAEAEGLRLTPDPAPEQVIFVRSDHYPFVQQGIPALYLIPGYTSKDPAIDGEARVKDFIKNHYHRPSDDLALPVDWTSALQFTRINFEIGRQVANAEAPPEWNPDDFFGELFGAD